MKTAILSEQDWRCADKRYDTELWDFAYDTVPYLERVSDKELDERYAHIVNNIDFLVCELRDAPPEKAHFVSSWWWLKTKFQTECEYKRRNRALPPVNNPPVSNYSVPFSPTKPNKNSFIVKYGEASWLKPMLEKGVVRINHASKYQGETPETDAARHDDELNMHRYTSGRGAKITVVETGQTAPILGNICRTVSAPNYYVLCCSNEFDYRLFSAFKNEKGEDADACLVVKDVDEFSKRLEAAVKESLPDWRYFDTNVLYYDPYNHPPRGYVSPGVSKDFKYAYQREYRFLWNPPVGQSAEGYFDVTLGSLEDIAELRFCQNGQPYV